MNMFEFAMYILVPILTLMWYYEKKRFDIEGINWHPFSDSSFPNPSKRLKGNFWWNNTNLKNRFKKSAKNNIKLDNFVFSDRFKRELSPLKFPFFKPAQIHIPALSFVESFLLIAPMKGGKTTTLMNWIDNDFYDRMLVNEQKGDMLTKFYNKRKDFILNPFDERGSCWDLMSEPIPIIEFYIVNALNEATKDESFFSSSARERYSQIAKLTIDIQDPKEKWKVFLAELEYMFKEIETGNQKSAKDVASTMKLILEPLQMTAFLIEQGKKSFTISDWYERKHQSKIWMLMKNTYRISLNPLFTGFTACVAMHQASQPEYVVSKSITAFLLDEYLSINLIMEARKILHTMTRSKGSAILSALQKLPSDEEERDLLISTCFGLMIFSVQDISTREILDKKIGKWEYGIYKTVNNHQSETTKESNILDWSEMDKLSANFHHVTYLPESGALYVGKSDYVDYPMIHKDFIYDTKVDDFYRWQNEEYQKTKNKKSNGASATMQAAQAS
ncbi:hypothetical protein Suden_1621 [Sulfurimonas denitrificans DSM 1251]|uniref:Type IV secretion system coupling protein TraD DNA-binding domain-containing protein n=1 Tax=Sulfurimonas denitrificans (strain ATCC 33889 / DSM 1251) TaxID=326298 RepID=Q30Q33_SULDN|nr:type IV secretion system DNA-binding domain-containing protein [Sulfurimonas denitrificans]ABB44898.1 hypothetical protein Suden_1621 [Sulfurimonas denitrificans DSM 1251]